MILQKYVYIQKMYNILHNIYYTERVIDVIFIHVNMYEVEWNNGFF